MGMARRRKISRRQARRMNDDIDQKRAIRETEGILAFARCWRVTQHRGAVGCVSVALVPV